MRGLPQKRNTSESMLRKQSSVCSCVFLCEYNPFFVELSSCCHLYGGPSCLPPYFLKSPLLTKCCICLPRSDSQVCWHTHCTVSAILSSFPLSRISLLNLFKIFRQVSCLSDCIMVLPKSVYLIFLSFLQRINQPPDVCSSFITCLLFSGPFLYYGSCFCI